MQASPEAVQQYQLKVQSYLKVFYALIVVTVVEVAIVFLPIPRILIDLGVVGLSISKAFLVGWFYMHLNHETRWVKIVAVLPIIMFFYAVFLVTDGARRPASPYIGAPERVLKSKAGHGAVEASKETAEGSPASEATSQASEPAAEATAEPATNP